MVTTQEIRNALTMKNIWKGSSSSLRVLPPRLEPYIDRKGHWDPAVEGGKVSIVLLNQFNQNVKDDLENCKYQLDRSRNN